MQRKIGHKDRKNHKNEVKKKVAPAQRSIVDLEFQELRTTRDIEARLRPRPALYCRRPVRFAREALGTRSRNAECGTEIRLHCSTLAAASTQALELAVSCRGHAAPPVAGLVLASVQREPAPSVLPSYYRLCHSAPPPAVVTRRRRPPATCRRCYWKSGVAPGDGRAASGGAGPARSRAAAWA